MKNKAFICVLIIISFVISSVVVILNYKGILKSGMELLQHIITVDSIILGFVTLTLTIMMTIKDGSIYKKVKRVEPRIIQQIYGYSTSSLLTSIISIVLSLIIIMTKQYVDCCAIYKTICVFFSSALFVYMILSVLMSYLQSIQMLQLDDDEKA